MMAKKLLIYFLIMLLTAYPASAGDVSLDRWVLNVTLQDDGVVNEAIQVEIDNGGSSPLQGISFVVPAERVTVAYGFYDTFSSKGQIVEQQTVPGGTKLIVNFNESVKPGEKWDGRISLRAENWAVKEGRNFSIRIPVQAPEAIISGKNVQVALPADADIRSQVFLPPSYEVTYVAPKPFRTLFQYDKMVPTWTPDKLHIGDTIIVNSAFSDILNKIVVTDEKYRELAARVKEAKAKGKDVSDAEMHLDNVNNYVNRQAFGSYEKKEYDVALKFVGDANDELKQAETSLSGVAEQTAAPARSTPGLGGAGGLISVFVVYFMVKRKK